MPGDHDTVSEPATDVLLTASIARRFYIENRSKTEIADEFMISRFKVARILEAALAQGIVRIDISVPAEIDLALSLELQQRFGLAHATVVAIAAEGGDEVRREQVPRWLGAAAARLLSEIVEQGDVVGLAWGRSVNACGEAVTRLAPCDVVQLSGAHPEEWSDDNAVLAVRRTAMLSGGRAFPLHSPLVVPNALTASILGRQREVAETLRQFDRVTKAVVEIGAWKPTLSTVYDALTPLERETCRNLGVRAEVCAHLLDAGGSVVETAVGDRMVSIGIDQLRKIPEVIGVAGGEGKAEAMQVVLESGMLTGIVTDTSTARSVLRLP
ncbi:transcriptional regulator [Streptomyces sp. CHD11]|uniref:sugar-binding transcriptional regulator n=1 Tax=Streptomyces sp. CHD11 TaxID=2741325 RepID=UPI001BFC496A|nr:sugar-binding domain-containing protein [Streptomyces sp. CHD11]MBT3150427.1 transcriptional regulator [Streptomyces sp. CHD11]